MKLRGVNMFCVKCGTELADDAKFCPVCGTPVAAEEKTAQPENPAPAPQPEFQQAPAPVQAPVQAPAPQPEYRVEDDEAGFTPTQRKILIRTMAVISYLGAYLFFPMFAFKDKKWLRQHVNNGLVLLIFEAGFTTIMIVPFVGWVIGIAGLFMCMVLAIMGIINSVKGQSYQMFWFFGKIKILK